MFSILIKLGLISLASSLPIVPRQTTTVCATGVHIIVARGSNEPQGQGDLQAFSDSIKLSIPGSTDTAVVYPAEIPTYFLTSEPQGVTNMKKLIEDYVSSCPDARLVLTGYSQGAHVLGDVLGGGTFDTFANKRFGKSPPLEEKYRKNIVAAVQFGDPARTPGEDYNAGDAGVGKGIFARADTTRLHTYAARLRSFCAKGDPVCDTPGLDVGAHLAEVSTFFSQALGFVVSVAGSNN